MTHQSSENKINLYSATAIVIGAVIGSGIFVSTAGMARSLGSAPWLLAVWVLGGFFSLLGALTLCELAAQIPKTGGLYEHIKHIYGKQMGFLFGWANFLIAGSGCIAGVAFVFANYLGQFVTLPHLPPEFEAVSFHIPMLGTFYPLADFGVKMVGSALVILLTWINARGTGFGAWLQSLSTTAKVVAMLVVVGVAFIGGRHIGSTTNFFGATEAGHAMHGFGLIGAVGLALAGAFWSYGGWNQIAFVAGEVRDPEKNVPRAILLGTFCFTSLYILINLAYLYILPVSELGAVANDRVASAAVSKVLGGWGGAAVAALVMLSTFDSTNSSVLTNARVYYAMAREGLFLKKAGELHPKHGTPHVALWAQGLWSLVLLFSGSFNIIANMYVFTNWVVFALMAAGVFILRRREPNAVRPFKVPYYPWVPALFLLFSAVYMIVTLIQDIHDYRTGAAPIINSLVGLVLIFTGVPLYAWLKRSAPEALADDVETEVASVKVQG